MAACTTSKASSAADGRSSGGSPAGWSSGAATGPADRCRPAATRGLFFLDDATALAAGHRPCAECRRDDYRSFLGLTRATRADELDNRLHTERGRLHKRELDGLPDGVFVLIDGDPWLVLGSELLLWTPGGYTGRRPRLRGRIDVVTPPTSVGVLATGWSGSVPLLHPSASQTV